LASIPEESLEKLLYFRREIDRIFKAFFDPRRKEAVSGGGHVDLILDVFETSEEIVMEIDLPGLAREDIELSVLRDVIIIEGKKKKAAVTGEVKFHCLERNFGRFRRIVEIPRAGDTSNIRGEYVQGVLRVSLPKIEDRRGQKRKVPVD